MSCRFNPIGQSYDGHPWSVRWCSHLEKRLFFYTFHIFPKQNPESSLRFSLHIGVQYIQLKATKCFAYRGPVYSIEGHKMFFQIKNNSAIVTWKNKFFPHIFPYFFSKQNPPKSILCIQGSNISNPRPRHALSNTKEPSYSGLEK